MLSRLSDFVRNFWSVITSLLNKNATMFFKKLLFRLIDLIIVFLSKFTRAFKHVTTDILCVPGRLCGRGFKVFSGYSN